MPQSQEVFGSIGLNYTSNDRDHDYSYVTGNSPYLPETKSQLFVLSGNAKIYKDLFAQGLFLKIGYIMDILSLSIKLAPDQEPAKKLFLSNITIGGGYKQNIAKNYFIAAELAIVLGQGEKFTLKYPYNNQLLEQVQIIKEEITIKGKNRLQFIATAGYSF